MKKPISDVKSEKILFVAQPWWATFNTTALKLNFSDQNGVKEKCLENTLRGHCTLSCISKILAISLAKRHLVDARGRINPVSYLPAFEHF